VQVVACTVQPLLLAAAASIFAAQFQHVVCRSLFSSSSSPVASMSHSSDTCDALLSNISSHVPAGARLLIAEHCATCNQANYKLCKAWAVAAVPLLLSQVCTQGLKLCSHCDELLLRCGAMPVRSCKRKQLALAVPVFHK
jgi:hypothetical protein